MKLMKLVLCVLACAGWCCVTNVNAESLPALDITGGSPGYNYEFCLGWSFSVQEDFVITSLGVYDPKNDGAVGETVALFEWDGSILASTTIPAEALNEGNSYCAVYYGDLDTPITVTAGKTYLVAGHVNPGDYVFNCSFGDLGPQPFTHVCGYATGVNIGTMPIEANSTTFPISGPNAPCYYGGTFKYTAVPEPSTMALFLMGVLVLVIWKKRR